MQPVTTAFLTALRGPHTLDVHVEAWRAGTQVGGTLQVLGGQVENASSTQTSPRRTLSLDLAPVKGLWDALAPAGTTLYVSRGVRYVDGSVERVPLGVFDVDEQSLGYAADGAMSLTAPDVWVRVTRARFETARSTVGSALNSAVTLAAEAIGLGTGSLGGDFSHTSRQQTWTTDRDDAINQLADGAAAWVYADAAGRVTSRAVPSLYQTPVWTIDASQTGVLLDASRSRNRQRTYNVIVVSGGEVNGVTPFNPVTVADNDSDSPTYVGGTFGRVPYFMSIPSLTTTAQAQAVGAAQLRRITGLAAQLDITTVVNPALEAGDVVQVLLPPRHGDTARVERHLIDSVTTPLTADGTQQITTRSTRPEGDVFDDTGGIA